MSTAEFMRAITTVPSAVPMLAYVAEARQPPTFVAFKPAGGPSSYAPATRARPRASYWLEGEARTPLTEPVNAVAELEAVVAPGPRSAVDWDAVDARLGRTTPPDFYRLIDTLGAVSVGRRLCPRRTAPPPTSSRNCSSSVTGWPSCAPPVTDRSAPSTPSPAA
ncbi:hypothetical protein AB0C29_22220 [Actinoplanes sp. NPDC048791]|uniref:hypothetical protein n=1 Tax=Actinoplanes sp. NPDC048791 TaxID=3154623 RepID=UPI0033D4BA48